MKLKNHFFNVVTVLRRKLQQLLRIKTIGVRALVMNEQGQVLLVRHTYTPGWHFPGGGVDHQETTAAAALREAYEEAGIVTHDQPTLIGIYYHTVRGADDYVALYAIHSSIQKDVKSPEIAECAWFDVDDLPAQTTQSTKDHLAEYLAGKNLSHEW